MSDLDEAHATIRNLLAGMQGWERKYNALAARLASAERRESCLEADIAAARRALERMLEISFMEHEAPGERLRAIRDNIRALLAPERPREERG